MQGDFDALFKFLQQSETIIVMLDRPFRVVAQNGPLEALVACIRARNFNNCLSVIKNVISHSLGSLEN